eukprot:m.2291 g.2291  ORF g.2291 m.2291 type:complete len:53 (-) comp1459_c0_seq1:482-640(-)
MGWLESFVQTRDQIERRAFGVVRLIAVMAGVAWRCRLLCAGPGGWMLDDTGR